MAAKRYLQGINTRAAVIFDAPSRDALRSLVQGENLPARLVLCGIYDLGDLLGQSLEIDEWLSFSVWNEPNLRRDLKAELAKSGRAAAKVKPLAGKLPPPAGDADGAASGAASDIGSQDDAPAFSPARAYLEGEPRRIALVYDAASRAALYSVLPATRFPKYLMLCRNDALDQVARQGVKIDEWLVFSVGNEEALCQDVAAALAGAGRAADTVSALSGKSAALAEPGQGDGLLPYAVLCAPRCGSTFLTQLLASAGFGTPLEHLRSKQIAQIAEMNLGEDSMIAMLSDYMRKHRRHGIFGSKVISQFLFEMIKKNPPSKSLRDFVRAQFSVIYLVRKDKVGQALSFFLAQHSGTWHARTAETPETMLQAQDRVEYDFEELLKRYRIMLVQDRRLTILARSTRHWVLFYEDLENDPPGSIALAARFLNRPVFGVPSARIQKIESPVSQRFRAQFNADYLARFGTLPEDYVPGEDGGGEAEEDAA